MLFELVLVLGLNLEPKEKRKFSKKNASFFNMRQKGPGQGVQKARTVHPFCPQNSNFQIFNLLDPNSIPIPFLIWNQRLPHVRTIRRNIYDESMIWIVYGIVYGCWVNYDNARIGCQNGIKLNMFLFSPFLCHIESNILINSRTVVYEWVTQFL